MRKHGLIISSLALLLGLGVAGGLSAKNANKVEKAEAADYSSTIRVYVDLNWANIDYVRVGGRESSDNAALSSSNAKYNQSLGKYVKDVSSSSTYTAMGCFFSENGQWSYVEYSGQGDGYAVISGGFKPNYEYQIKIGTFAYQNAEGKAYHYEVYEIGEITDNVSDATVYFVDGHSWHSGGNVYVHYWGGTASSTYPGSIMTDTGLRLKAYVGETEYSGLRIYKYTISGSCAYVQFNNNSSKTGDLRPVNGQVYFFGVDAEEYGGVANLLVTLGNQMGSYTYDNKSFTNSICHLSQSQASTFISTYNTLENSSEAKVVSSVRGSGVETYTSPETSTTITGEVSLPEIKAALIKKYPSLSSFGKLAMFGSMNSSTGSTVIAVAIVAVVTVSAIAAYFIFRRKRTA